MQPQDPDSLYQGYDKNLYRITGDEESDSIMEMLSSDPTQNNSGNVQVSSSDIGSGVNTATSPQATGSIQAGKQTFTDTTDGYFLGIVNGLGVFSLGGASSYVKWDGTTLSVVGGVSISQLDIPDTTTANSFHVDTSGNTWWGANVASGLSAANASITSAGAATFKNVVIGGTTVQYVVTNSGIFSYGDGSDGDVTISVNTTLTSDMNYNNLTVNTGINLNPGGYRISVKGSLTLNGTGKISGDGTAGNLGQDGINTGNPVPVGGASVSMADGYLKGSVSTGGGASPSILGPIAGVAGGSGAAAANSLGTAGQSGGAGGAAANAGGTGGTPGACTVANVKLTVGVQLAWLLDVTATGATLKYNNSSSSGGGGSGASDTNIYGAAGGSGGCNGRIIAIYARNIIIASGASISSNGGIGGAGGNAYQPSGNNGGGGGGAGGNGGVIILVYNTLTNSGSITATHGAGGTGGIKSGTGLAGSNGSNGSDGTIYQFQLSL